MTDCPTSFWLDRNVFVTGCTGFLGSWLTVALVDRGANVIGLIFDEDLRSHLARSGYDRRIRRVYGSVTDYVLMERVLNEHDIEVIFHLAAQPLVRTGYRAPLSTFETGIVPEAVYEVDLMAKGFCRPRRAGITRTG